MEIISDSHDLKCVNDDNSMCVWRGQLCNVLFDDINANPGWLANVDSRLKLIHPTLQYPVAMLYKNAYLCLIIPALNYVVNERDANYRKYIVEIGWGIHYLHTNGFCIGGFDENSIAIKNSHPILNIADRIRWGNDNDIKHDVTSYLKIVSKYYPVQDTISKTLLQISNYRCEIGYRNVLISKQIYNDTYTREILKIGTAFMLEKYPLHDVYYLFNALELFLLCDRNMPDEQRINIMYDCIWLSVLKVGNPVHDCRDLEVVINQCPQIHVGRLYNIAQNISQLQIIFDEIIMHRDPRIYEHLDWANVGTYLDAENRIICTCTIADFLK